MSKLKIALFAGILTVGIGATGAVAMPVANLDGVDIGTTVEKVRWVCNPWGGCWWQPGYAYGYYRPYRYYGGPGLYFGGPRFYGRRWGRRW